MEKYPTSWVVTTNPAYCPICIDDICVALAWNGLGVNGEFLCHRCGNVFLKYKNILVMKGGDGMARLQDVWGKFWMCITEQGQSTSKRHSTLALAKREAERLCRQEKCEVAILEVTEICKVEQAPVTWEKPDYTNGE